MQYEPQKKRPIQIVQQFFEHFNNHDVEALADLYSDTAVNWQVAEQPLNGKTQIRESFEQLFKQFPDIGNEIIQLHETTEDWAICEWKGKDEMKNQKAQIWLNGCGFFQIINEKIVLQRGYWDKISWLKQQGTDINKILNNKKNCQFCSPNIVVPYVGIGFLIGFLTFSIHKFLKK